MSANAWTTKVWIHTLPANEKSGRNLAARAFSATALFQRTEAPSTLRGGSRERMAEVDGRGMATDEEEGSARAKRRADMVCGCGGG